MPLIFFNLPFTSNMVIQLPFSITTCTCTMLYLYTYKNFARLLHNLIIINLAKFVVIDPDGDGVFRSIPLLSDYLKVCNVFCNQLYGNGHFIQSLLKCFKDTCSCMEVTYPLSKCLHLLQI